MRSQGLRQRLVFFIGKQPLRKRQIFLRGKLRFADRVPKRSPEQSAFEKIVSVAESSLDGFLADRIEQETSISEVLIVCEDKSRTRFADHAWEVHCLFVELDMYSARMRICISKQ